MMNDELWDAGNRRLRCRKMTDDEDGRSEKDIAQNRKARDSIYGTVQVDLPVQIRLGFTKMTSSHVVTY